jgi:parallel beta-helix repeat protein
MTNNSLGVYIMESANNLVSSNSRGGIFVMYSENITLINNTMEETGLTVSGPWITYWNSHSIDTSNTIQGKPVYYWVNQNGGTVPEGAGMVILAQCSNIIIENQNCSNSIKGIMLGYCNDITIVNNTLSNNLNYGIYLWQSDRNIIKGNIAYSNRFHSFLIAASNDNEIINNTCMDNDYGIGIVDTSTGNIVKENDFISNRRYGVYITETSDNYVYHNNIINNAVQANESFGTNYWDNGYPSGGNYWSDYLGVDDFRGPLQDIPGSDGIGDTPYVIDTFYQDDYPLMDPWGRYLYLSPGWNLASIPNVISPTDPENLFDSMKENWSAVQYYDVLDTQDHWKHENPSKPIHMDDFEDIDNQMGFWIKVTEPKGIYFECPGTPPVTNQFISLYKGWNMVGYPSFSRYERTQALNNLDFGNQVDALWTYNARTQGWEEVDESSYLFKGRGYWIHATSDCVWEVPL